MYDWEVNCLAPPCVPNFQDRHELPSVALILGCHAKAQLNKNDLLEHRILQCKSYSTNSTSVYWPNILQLHLCFVIIFRTRLQIKYLMDFFFDYAVFCMTTANITYKYAYAGEIYHILQTCSSSIFY
jgi:hypothetical protein